MGPGRDRSTQSGRCALIGALLLAAVLLPARHAACGFPELIRAVERADAAAVRAEIDAGVDVNRLTEYGASALALAAQSQNEQIVRMLLDAGADPNLLAGRSAGPLHVAAFLGDGALAELLIDRGANVHKPMRMTDLEDGGVVDRTPLWLAIHEGHPGVVDVLLRHGAGIMWTGRPEVTILADPTAPNANSLPILDEPALDNAVDHAADHAIGADLDERRIATVELMVRAWTRRRALGNFHLSPVPEPLDRLIKSNDVGGVRDLINTGGLRAYPLDEIAAAVMAARRAGRIEVADLLHERGASLAAHLSRRDAPIRRLYDAATNGDYEAAVGLIEAGVDPNEPLPDRNSSAVERAARYDRVDVLDLFARHGGDLANAPGQWGPPIHAAVTDDAPATAAYLIERGIRPQDDLLDDALVLVAGRASVDAVRSLLRWGASPTAIAPHGPLRGHTPLMRAAEAGNIEVVLLLLRLGVEVNRANPDGYTAVALAAANLEQEVVDALIRAGARPATSLPPTPIDRLVLKNDRAAVDRALAAGISPDAMATEQWSALDFALRRRCYAAALGLLDGGARLTIAQIRRSSRGVDDVTPSTLAVALGNGDGSGAWLDVVVTIIARGADVNEASGTDGATPLTLAAASGSHRAVELLLDAGARPEISDADGRTALDIALERGDKQLADLLMSR